MASRAHTLSRDVRRGCLITGHKSNGHLWGSIGRLAPCPAVVNPLSQDKTNVQSWSAANTTRGSLLARLTLADSLVWVLAPRIIGQLGDGAGVWTEDMCASLARLVDWTRPILQYSGLEDIMTCVLSAVLQTFAQPGGQTLRNVRQRQSAVAAGAAADDVKLMVGCNADQVRLPRHSRPGVNSRIELPGKLARALLAVRVGDVRSKCRRYNRWRPIWKVNITVKIVATLSQVGDPCQFENRLSSKLAGTEYVGIVSSHRLGQTRVTCLTAEPVASSGLKDGERISSKTRFLDQSRRIACRESQGESLETERHRSVDLCFLSKRWVCGKQRSSQAALPQNT
ncbi:hypothetical protein RRG08_000472 [Elysia crispata]|uniref:Uncharacterized protein n=1 Tax=Elysia crispata TaxID=231223 RepID=A0AAE1CW90_9GAST|nr:hypothetical protein RRG08_000472 [Elysia crispata]